MTSSFKLLISLKLLIFVTAAKLMRSWFLLFVVFYFRHDFVVLLFSSKSKTSSYMLLKQFSKISQDSIQVFVIAFLVQVLVVTHWTPIVVYSLPLIVGTKCKFLPLHCMYIS